MDLRSADSIIDFYNPQVNGVDRRGRTRAQIVAWSKRTQRALVAFQGHANTGRR